MLISALIRELVDKQQEYGDIEVWIETDDGRDREAVTYTVYERSSNIERLLIVTTF